ncbi:MAG: Mur ligase family protein [Rhizobiaceae bacterium]
MPARSEELQQALGIPVPDDPSLVLDGCRRLLGPNVYSDQLGAVGDGLISAFDPAAVLGQWQGHVRALIDSLGWRTDIVTRPFDGGASLFFAVQADQLMTAAYVIEAGWYFTACDLLGQTAIAFDRMATDIATIALREASPPLVQLLEQARRRGIDQLLDDDAVTLGHGEGGQTFDTAALPTNPDWSALHDIPLALVTGTNGKTTTTRLIAAMGQKAGKVSGLSSTDFVRVGDEILDRGDYSGPAGARLLLRDPRLELGVLEVARGGILRRGLPVTRARAAVVTNVAADHLGQYGINTVRDMAEIKLTVRRGLASGGWLILNAEDAMLRAAARGLGEKPVWFALDAARDEIRAARAARQPCGWLQDEVLILSDGAHEIPLIAAANVPLTLGGAARYNIENALGAALAGRALGLPDAAIRDTLATFRSDAKDNPGRANEFSVNGARVFVDFAHNPHSIAAVTSALAALPAKRRLVLLMHAGDRSDDEIRALVEGAFALRPDHVVIAENPKYLRGRQPGVIPTLIRATAISLGCPADRILLSETPTDGARRIISQLQPGDLALLLVHAERQEIFDMLSAATGL